MGQSLMKLTPAGRTMELMFRNADELNRILSTETEGLRAEDRPDEKKANEIGLIIEQFYDEYFGDNQKKWESAAEFYHAICEAVQAINKKMGNTQIRIPHFKTFEIAYNTHHKAKEQSITKEEFQKILQEVAKDTGVSGGGIKDMLYIIGVPVTAWFIKERAAPQALSNDVFIPGVTSATVFVLAQLNKL